MKNLKLLTGHSDRWTEGEPRLRSCAQRIMSATDKLTKISGFGIAVSQELEGRVNTMCNLGQGLIDEGRKEGRIAEAVDIYRTEMGLDDESIIRKICDKFSLTNDRARAYVRGKKRNISAAV